MVRKEVEGPKDRQWLPPKQTVGPSGLQMSVDAPRAHARGY